MVWAAVLQAQGVDEDALVGDGCRHPFEFGKMTTGGRQLLQDRRRLEASRVQVFQGQDGGRHR